VPVGATSLFARVQGYAGGGGPFQLRLACSEQDLPAGLPPPPSTSTPPPPPPPSPPPWNEALPRRHMGKGGVQESLREFVHGASAAAGALLVVGVVGGALLGA